MICYPNCKINLGLDILRRREDGFHDIETLMYPVPLADILEIVPADGDEDTLSVSGNKVDCPPDKNLVMKAVRATRAVRNFPCVNIFLHKIIPDGAGLGGGSADAAFTIKLLNDIFSLGLNQSQQAEIASGIGSDCPFFIYDKPMLATGRGTDLEFADVSLKGLWILIAKPSDAHVSTAQAYAGVTPCIPESSLISCIQRPVKEWGGCVVNMFEKSVFPQAPSVALLKNNIMEANPVFASMTGSGAAVFGLFDHEISKEHAEAICPGCFTFVARL